jgi:transcriptional regulator with XRE-family HTH domain
MASKSLNPVDRHVGARLRKRRLAHGISQIKLGSLAGVTFQQVQKYEKGSNRISSSRLQLFAIALKVSAEYFFDGLRVVTSNPTAMAYVDEFTNSPDGLALSRAFQKIADQKLRRSIVALVERIAGPRRAFASDCGVLTKRGAGANKTSNRHRSLRPDSSNTARVKSV